MSYGVTSQDERQTQKRPLGHYLLTALSGFAIMDIEE